MLSLEPFLPPLEDLPTLLFPSVLVLRLFVLLNWLAPLLLESAPEEVRFTELLAYII